MAVAEVEPRHCKMWLNVIIDPLALRSYHYWVTIKSTIKPEGWRTGWGKAYSKSLVKGPLAHHCGNWRFPNEPLRGKQTNERVSIIRCQLPLQRYKKTGTEHLATAHTLNREFTVGQPKRLIFHSDQTEHEPARKLLGGFFTSIRTFLSPIKNP